MATLIFEGGQAAPSHLYLLLHLFFQRRKFLCQIEMLRREIDQSLYDRDRAAKEAHELRYMLYYVLGPPPQPPTVACKMEAQLGMCTSCTHVFAHLAFICMLSRCL